MTPIRVVIVDDQPLVRSGIRLVVEAADDLESVGEAADGRAALQVIRQTRPGVALMDLRMPVLDGIATIRQLTQDERLDATRYLVLTTFDHDELVTSAIRARASGYLLKDTSPEQLRQAIRDTAAGNAPLSPTIAKHLIAGLAHPPSPPTQDPERLAVLTEREREMLTHVGRIMTKLQARDRASLVVIAYETGHVRPGDPQRS